MDQVDGRSVGGGVALDPGGVQLDLAIARSGGRPALAGSSRNDWTNALISALRAS